MTYTFINYSTLLSILFSASLFANESKPLAIAYYHSNVWEVDNVIGKTIIRDIVLSPDNQILLSTNIGIKTFDGKEFRDVFDKSLNIK